jgi:twinkle protein
MVHTAIDHRRKWVVFSPESQPWEQFAAQCAEVYVGRPFYRERDRAAMTDEEVQEAEAWLSDRVTMLVCDAEDQAPTLDWILERARVAVLQTGCTDLVIDPWNEVQHERRDMSETDYTGFALQRLKAFGLRHGVNVWAAVHPRIPPPLKPGETRAAPGPYDCSGSAHFANKADLGITIHSPEPPFTQLHLWKARFRRWGQKNQMAQMEYEPSSGRYRTRDAPIVDGVGIVSDAIRGSW